MGELEAANVVALQEKNEVYLQLEAERSVGGDAESRFHAVMAQKIDVESTLKDVEERLMDEEDANATLGAQKKKLGNEAGELKRISKTWRGRWPRPNRRRTPRSTRSRPSKTK